ncbi:MAG: hypothetical protein V4608_10900 [Bacteroidota bacterium]
MRSAQKIIEAGLNNLKIDIEAETKTSGEKVKDVFCDNFDNFEKIVEFTIIAVKNPIARWIMKLALLIGNRVQDNICPKEKG